MRPLKRLIFNSIPSATCHCPVALRPVGGSELSVVHLTGSSVVEGHAVVVVVVATVNQSLV